MSRQNMKIQIMDAIVSVGWTHKIQEKQAEIYLNRARNWQMAQLITSGLTSTGIFTLISWPNQLVQFLTAAGGLIAFISSGVSKAYNFSEMATGNKNYANKQFMIREQLMELASELAFSDNLDDIDSRWREINKLRIRISEDAPMTSDKACKIASRQLKYRGDNNREQDYSLFF